MKHRADRRRGMAMVVVLLTLMALLVLCTPFLMTVRNADQASAQLADRRSLELVLDSAERLADARLGASHPALDPTPYHDSLDELRVANDLDESFLDASDTHGAMFDLEAHDVSGRIDLNSAPPQVIANLMGAAAVTLASAEPTDTELKVSSTDGFLPKGFLWMEGELVGYSGLERGAFTGLVRGLGAEVDAEGKPLKCGPRPARALDSNTLIVDQRAYALAQWRAWTPDGRLRTFDAVEEVRSIVSLIMAEELGDAGYDALEHGGTVYAGLGAGAEWGHGARVRNELKAGEDCTLRLEHARWFNEGTTLRISDGRVTELAIVRGAGQGNAVELMQAVTNDYPAFTAIAEPLARRPVNVNTASAEVLRALLLNLQLRGHQSRITRSEADDLVEVIVESRPFTCFEDFAQRIVLPAAGWEPLPSDAPVVPKLFQTPAGGKPEDAAGSLQILDEDDARALYKNALNANDAELSFSTMPFAFTSTETHALELRAAVNADSGIERARGVRLEVKLVVPQRELMYLATRQEDFEDAFRLDGDSPGWATGPYNTSRFDPSYGSSPPTRSRPHLGPRDTMPSSDPLGDGEVYTFASRDEEQDQGFAEPWVARVAEVGDIVGRVLHYDDEQKRLDGRYLPEGREVRASGDALVGWLDARGLQRPFSFSMWIKPEELEDGALFLDTGGPFGDSDRVSLLLEDGFLVLRVQDGAADHPDTSFEEVAEARYELAPGTGAGMPADTWIHVQADVRGNRPDQIALLVDGKWRSEVRGLTRLTSGIGSDAGTIPVESTDGFPSPCVLRIGNELIEAVVAGPTSFTATFQSTGESAGFGGRAARVEFLGVDPGVPEAILGGGGAYQSGTPVALYGYALAILGNVQAGEASLTSDLGPFAVGQVVGMEAQGSIEGAKAILVELDDGTLFTVGTGLELPSEAMLNLAPVDPGMEPEEVMEAFDRNGGYAVLMQVAPTLRVTNTTTGDISDDLVRTNNEVRIGGIEIVHYAGWEGTLLHIDQRGDQVQLPNQVGLSPLQAGKGAFVFEWSPYVTIGALPPNEHLFGQTKVFPISIGVSGAGALAANVTAANPALAQITRLGGESGLTEWVRYDYSTGTDLVRDNPADLLDLYTTVQNGMTEVDGEGTTTPGPGGSGTGGPGGGGGAPAPPPAAFVAEPPAPPPAAPPPALDGSYWHYRLGDEENDDDLMTRSVRSHLQFRGVFGTYDHAQPQGAVVLPVWETLDGGPDFGYPGRFDAVALIDQEPSAPGFTGIVHHAHRPRQYTVYGWQEDPGNPLVPAPSGGGEALNQPVELAQTIYVALEGPMAVPVAGSAAVAPDATPYYDSRVTTRVAKFPSGELPRGVTTVALGGAFQTGSGVPAASIDEVVFGNSDFAGNEDTHGAQMVLTQPIDAQADALQVEPNSLRVPLGLISFAGGQFLTAWPTDAGLLRIGDEILCYQGLDAGGGVVTLAENGRGLLGTDAQPHAAGEAVSLLECIEVGVLGDGVGGEDASLVLTDAGGFPTEGLVLIEDELVHYAWLDGASTLMQPRASSEPGARDGKGPGLFRGRFGTTPAAHAPAVPVVLYPFRYWDRWAERADAPEMHYLCLSASQPAAFWRTAFFDVEEAGADGPRMGVLQRTDPAVPWDADPGDEEDLELLTDGLPGGHGNPVGRQSDRIEWRVFVRWEPGSYDPVLGLAHGWKMAPRLAFLGAEYFGPGMVLRRVGR